MKFELNSLPRNCSDEEIFAEIKRVDTLVGKDILTKKDFEKYGRIHTSTIIRRFGDWSKALQLAGLSHKYIGRSITAKQRDQEARVMTDDEILTEIKKIAIKLKKEVITVEDVKKYSTILGPAIVRRRFGSWTAGMVRAGLKVSDKYHRRFSDEEYFENLLNVWTHYGRPPTCGEMRMVPSEIGADGYINRFGGWRKALEAFVKRMNQDEGGANKQIVKKENVGLEVKKENKRDLVLIENRRNISLGLRFKVFSRDKFKCIKCGESPATNHSCLLHVDHKIPFSKGGKTILENLQTLCEKCNLGKGNRYLE